MNQSSWLPVAWGWLVCLPLSTLVHADEATHPHPDWARMRNITPRSYECQYTQDSLSIDGKLDEPAWQSAQWTDDFVDIEADVRPKPTWRTRVKMLWSDTALLIGVEMEEPHVWGTIKAHDEVMFQDNDFEVFLDPDGDRANYGELELNALNTTWDLFLRRTYRDGVIPDNGWEIAGLQTAVDVQGTINDARDLDQGWTLEIALPWRGLSRIVKPEPPRPGTLWRVNFSRVQWDVTHEGGTYRKVPDRREHNWVWSPTGVIDMHRPERWGWVRFVTPEADPGTSATAANAPLDHNVWDPTGSARAREALLDIYYRNVWFREQNERSAKSLAVLGSDLAASHEPPFQLRWRNTPRGPECSAFWYLSGEPHELQLLSNGRLMAVPPPRDATAALHEVESALQAQVVAWNAGDLDRFLTHYWKSPDTHMVAQGDVVRGYWKIAERYRQRYPDQAAMGKLELSQLAWQALDNTSVLTHGTWQVTPTNGPAVQGRFTLVWRWIDEQWQIAHDHTSQGEAQGN